MTADSSLRGLGITIGATPASRDLSSMLDHDIALAKAAVLYADRTSLVSFSSTILIHFAAVAHGPENMHRESIKSLLLMATINHHPGIAKLIADSSGIADRLSRGIYVPAKKRTMYQNLQQQLDDLSTEIRAKFQEVIEDAGIAQLEAAMRAGLLEVKPIEGMNDINPEEWVWLYVEQLKKILSDPSAYPLFDQRVGDIVHYGIKEGVFDVSEAGMARSRHSGLAANLLDRLPLFERATMDEILEIRQELEKPLRQFRRAIIEFSEQIERAAWDPDFVFDAQNTFDKHVAPTVNNIEREVQDNSYLREILDRASEKPLSLAGVPASLGLAMTSMMPDLAAIALFASSTFPTVWPAYRKWRDQTNQIEENNLYFYYKAGERLKTRTSS